LAAEQSLSGKAATAAAQSSRRCACTRCRQRLRRQAWLQPMMGGVTHQELQNCNMMNSGTSSSKANSKANSSSSSNNMASRSKWQPAAAPLA
jgi:hypothetical protein